MWVSLALVGATLQPADFVISRCEAAHRRLKGATVNLRVDQSGFTSNERTVYDLKYVRSAGADVTVTRRRPMRVVVTPQSVLSFDSSTRQYTEKARSDESLGIAMQHGLDVADDVLIAVLEPGGVGAWLKDLRNKGEWTFANEPGLVSAECRFGEGRIVVSIDPKTDLLRHVVMKDAQYGTEWTLGYGGGPAEIAFQPPRGATKVSELRTDTVMPTFSSEAARKIVTKIFAKYDQPKRLAYEARSVSERSQVWIWSGSVRQNDDKADWSVSGGKFELVDKERGHTVQGEAALSKIVDAVAHSGTRVEPILKLLLRGQNPFRIYFGSNSNVSVTGSVQVDGRKCLLVESTSLRNKVSLVVRESDGFVLSLASRDAGKDALLGQVRTFRELKLTAASIKTAPTESHRVVSLKDYVAQS